MRLGFKHSEETKAKLRAHNLAHPRRYWLGKKRSNMIGNTYAKGNNSNQTSFKKGEHHSPATEFQKGINVSPTTQFKKGLSPWNKGKKLVEMKGTRNPFWGRNHTKETLQKISDAQKGRTGENAGHWKGGLYEGWRRASAIGSKGSFTRKQWGELKQKYGSMCLCCKRQEPEIKLEADHVIPVAVWNKWIVLHPEINYGCGDIKNIQPLCRTCNQSKLIQVIDYRNLIENKI